MYSVFSDGQLHKHTETKSQLILIPIDEGLIAWISKQLAGNHYTIG